MPAKQNHACIFLILCDFFISREHASIEPRTALSVRVTLSTGFVLNVWAVTYTSVFWKLYGQSSDGAHITSDQYLARVGAVSSLFNGASRILWGHLGDRCVG